MTARRPIVSVSGTRKQLPDGDTLAVEIPVRYNFFGAVTTSTGTVAYEFDGNYTLVSVYFFLQSASSSGSVNVVPRLDGSALGTLTAAASVSRSNKLSLSSNVSAGSKITVDITAAGTSASDMCVVFMYKPR